MSLRFARLTRPAIRRLKPGEKITEHGITAECLPNGDVRYSVNVMVDGQRVHRVIGRAGEGTTRSQAEAFIALARSDAKAGRLGLPKGRKLQLTFETAAARYMQKLGEGGGRNLREKGWHLRLHLVPYFGSMRLQQVSTFTVEKFRRRCQDKGLSVSSINQLLATYRHMGRKLQEWGDIDFIPPMVKLQAVQNRRDHVLDGAGKAHLAGC